MFSECSVNVSEKWQKEEQSQLMRNRRHFKKNGNAMREVVYPRKMKVIDEI